MHPTPDEQLQAVRRRLDQVDADPSLTSASREALDDAGRLLRRLERSWAERLPFLVLDNRLAADLLRDLAPRLPDLAGEIETVTVTAEQPADNEPAAHELNKRLQDLLGRAVHLLPDDPDGDEARARIADHLRSRLAADPALHRNPTERTPTQRAPTERSPSERAPTERSPAERLPPRP